MALKQNLQKDLAGEHKAIKDYSTRIQQTKGTKHAPMLTEIRSDEKDHKRLLTKAIAGLKSAKD